MTWKELVYMVADELKLGSDDSLFNEDHIVFLLCKYRSFILKQRYSDIKKNIPGGNYQTILLDVETLPNNKEGEIYLKSTIDVPKLISLGNIRVYANDYYDGEITYISKDRMRYIGHNKFLKNIAYCTKDPDGHLYFKSFNSELSKVTKVKMYAIFDDIKKAADLEDNEELDLMDKDFPIEESLVPPIIEFVVKELLGAEYRPEDSENNASDDLANLASTISRSNAASSAK